MSPVLDLDSGRLAYDDSGGDGPVVVLSHAGLADRRMWRSQRAALSARFRVISYDRLGFGESGAAPASVRPADGLLQLMDGLGVERAALVGCSMGAGYSLDAALLAPDRVWALGLICPGVPGYEWPPEMADEVRPLLHAAVPADRLTAYATHTAASVSESDVAAMAEAQLRYMALGGRDPSVFAEGVWDELLEMTRHVFAREWNEPPTREIEPRPAVLDRLGQIAVPTLVVNGACDVVYVQQLAGELARGIPGARRVDLAGVGHLPSVERPEELDALLVSFLTEADAGRDYGR